MQYMGGKSRIAKDVAQKISEIPERERERETLVSLFCGSCVIESKLTDCFDNVVCNDSNKYLIDMLNGVQNGYELPDYVSEEDYKYTKTHKEEDPVLTGFIGFGCSFGGRFFQGFARSKDRANYAATSKKSLLNTMETMKDVQFTCLDYRDVELPEGCVVYADPPYNGTKEYSQMDKFDTDAFWEYMREISKNHLVFISELNAPDDFVCIWQKECTRTLDRNKNNQFKSTEKLFVHTDWIKKLKKTQIKY